ncbi:Flavodoxin domain protein [Candidatus Tiddalikarchaeum anstoanum]|nr:Flavodoxin domain protein [Candidatus Tiddalikarchaeum anstoanum]
MAKTLIVYKSFLGSTRKYAKWLTDELKSDIVDMWSVRLEKLKEYDTIIVMSGTYANWMPLTGFLTKNWPTIQDKKVIVVAVGAAPENDPYSKSSYNKIPEHIRNKIKYFKIYGKFGNQGKEVEKDALNRIIRYLKN